MNRQRIHVECYAGGRADERPRRLIIEGRTHEVARLLNESLEESLTSKERSRRYRVLTDEGLEFEVVRSSDGDWYLAVSEGVSGDAETRRRGDAEKG